MSYAIQFAGIKYVCLHAKEMCFDYRLKTTSSLENNVFFTLRQIQLNISQMVMNLEEQAILDDFVWELIESWKPTSKPHPDYHNFLNENCEFEYVEELYKYLCKFNQENLFDFKPTNFYNSENIYVEFEIWWKDFEDLKQQLLNLIDKRKREKTWQEKKALLLTYYQDTNIMPYDILRCVYEFF